MDPAHMKSALENILYEKDDFLKISSGIEQLYAAWSQYTNVFAGDLTYDTMRNTSRGKVVTPAQAAHCVKDLARTTHFLRGIHLAILNYIKKYDQVRILYAGCGPYATLLTPFTALYSPDQLAFTFIEIEPVSYHAVLKLYEKCRITAYLEEIRLTDATDPTISFPHNFHIIISETMQVGLNNECQVPITRNLSRFLTPGGTFIPQRITLDVYLVGSYDTLRPDTAEKLLLGTAYDLDFKKVPPEGSTTTLEMPPSSLEYLQLFTEIYLFGDERLTARQSGLTLPLTLDRYVDRRPAKIHFTYEEGAMPKLSFEYGF